MPILNREDLSRYPGAGAEVSDPFTCAKYPTLQELATALVAVESLPTTIIHGKIVSETTAEYIETTVCPLI